MTHRDRLAALVTVLSIIGLCWAWLGKAIWDMHAMPMQDTAMLPSGQIAYLVWLALMWLVMMAAMMLPSALPMTLAFSRFAGSKGNHSATVPVIIFVSGYLATWGVFSLLAAAGQWWFEQIQLVSPMTMAMTNNIAAGGLLLVAGLYQWAPLKHICLHRCRTPWGFLLTEWREGLAGALWMGWRHGVFCVGCCWALMILLFVAGVMNALWIIGLTLLVVIEKVAPAGAVIARTAGLGLILVGLRLMIL